MGLKIASSVFIHQNTHQNFKMNQCSCVYSVVVCIYTGDGDGDVLEMHKNI